MEAVYNILPIRDVLDLIQKHIGHPIPGHAFRDVAMERRRVPQRAIVEVFKIDVENLGILHTGGAQVILKNLHQCGFAASADTGNDFDDVFILKGNQLLQVFFTLEPLGHHKNPSILSTSL